MTAIRILIFLAFLWPVLNANAQQIVWERRIESLYDDELFSITAADSGNYFACGFGARYTTIRGIGTKGIALLKLNANGDTVWTKTVNHGYKAQILYSKRGSIYMVSHTATFPGQSELHFFELSKNGGVIQDRLIDLQEQTLGLPIPEHMEFAPDSSILVCGNVDALRSSGNTADMWVARIEPRSGLTYWINRYNDHPYTQSFHIEPTPRGTYLASGTAGSRIWAIEIDSNGTEIRRQTFYQTPSLVIFENGAVKQAAGGNFIVSGFYRTSNNSKYFLGSFSQFSSAHQTWGSERTGSCLPPFALQDGEMVLYSTQGAGRQFTKYNSNGSVAWNSNLNNRLGAVSLGLNGYAFNADSSVTAVGTIYYNDPTSLDFYTVKIANVGVPYNPALIVGNRQEIADMNLVLYPNPSRGGIHLSGWQGQAQVEIYDMQGRSWLAAKNIQQHEKIDVQSLPKGLYMAKVMLASKVAYLRFVQE